MILTHVLGNLSDPDFSKGPEKKEISLDDHCRFKLVSGTHHHHHAHHHKEDEV